MTTQTKTKTPDTEDGRAKFTRLASSRVTKALNSIALVEQLANPQRYTYSEADVDAINLALDQAVVKATEALRAGKVSAASFSLEG